MLRGAFDLVTYLQTPAGQLELRQNAVRHALTNTSAHLSYGSGHRRGRLQPLVCKKTHPRGPVLSGRTCLEAKV